MEQIKDNKEMSWKVEGGILTIKIDLLKTAGEGVKHAKMPWGSVAYNAVKPLLKQIEIERDYDLIKDLPEKSNS